MLNKAKHQLVMVQILRDIYSDTSISSLIGFKGGTCAYLFYGLTRFSVDLDFDLFSSDESTQKLLYKKINSIIVKYGIIKDSYIKRNTIFFLISYGAQDHNIKVEINTRILMPNIREQYEMKEYLGISMMVAKKTYLFASKLTALTNRRLLAMRDIYDIWFFTQHHCDIDAELLKARTDKTVKKHISECISTIEAVRDNEILHGLAELLLGEKDKAWVKTHLRKETIFNLKNYLSVIGK